jgi:excisionase family DNA binding protein
MMQPNLPSLCDDGVATVPQAADFLGVRRSKVYDLMARGELPHLKIGTCRRIPRRALVAFLESRLVGGEALR